MTRGKDLSILRNLIYSLVLFGQIRTTKTRAKAIQGWVDRLVTKTKKGTVAAQRDVLQFLPQKPVVEKLTKEIIPTLGERTSGYTKILRVGRRPGDGASMVLMQWVKDEAPVQAEKTNETETTEKLNKTKNPKAPAKKKVSVSRKKNAKTSKTK